MNDIPLLLSCEILENVELSPKYFRMKINSAELAGCVKPGQFFHVRVADRLDIILRRPFSVFDFNETTVSILYEVVGKGTEVLSLRKPGEELDMLGPLGNGFSINPEVKKVIIVGGGIGIAPLFSWAKELKGSGLAIQVLIGAKNKYKVLCEEDFKKIGIIPEISTDDGSYGSKGLVTDMLRTRDTRYDEQSSRDTRIYACGPNKMLVETASIMREHNIPGQLSLDRHMACGLGVCLGCVVKTVDGKYKRVCKDGPAFNVSELDWG